MHTLNDVKEMFVKLGEPENVDKAFAVTHAALEDIGLSPEALMEAIPVSPYDHTVWWDTLTDNVLVARPDKDGKYSIPIQASVLRVVWNNVE